MNPHHGSSLESFLEDEGILEEVTERAIKAVFDAIARDPTGTDDLRTAFERELKDRWQRLDRCLNKAVGISDALGLAQGPLALIPAAARMKHFRSWLDELLSHLIVSGGDWMATYLDEAGERASSRAASLDPRKAAGGGLPTAPRIAGHDAAEDEPRDDHGRWTSAAPDQDDIAADPDYAYHATNVENASDIIAEKKLKPHGPSYGTEQESWPDGSEEKRSYWTHDPKIARSFYPEEGHPVLLRVKRSDADFKRESTGDLYSKKPITHSKIDVYVGAGQWGRLAKSQITDSATDDTILVLATSELQGICDAVSQQVSRLVSHCLLTRARPARAAQGIRQLIATVGLQRSRMMADYLVVKAHAAATLEAFREAGVTHVGTVAEMLPHVHVGDGFDPDEPRDKEGKWTTGSITSLPFSNSLALPDAPTAEEMSRSGRIEDVPLSQARATQNTMGGGIRSSLIKGYGDMPVAARREDGEYLIFDGHHRTVAAINEGKSSLKMHVIDVKDYSPEFQGRKPAPYTGPSDDDLLKALMGDAARKTPQHQHPTTGKFITKAAATREWGRRGSGKFGKAPKTYNRSIEHRRALRLAARVGEEVDVQTAGDDRVCATCQAISANGPYPIDEAMDLIPNHPRCRCVYVPASDEPKQV